MQVFRFKKMDAFAQGAASGNPAGCIYLEHDTVITGEEMQRIARDMKGFVNEVGYLRPVEDGFWLKFFSSECEVDFCGHATIAIMYELIRESADLIKRQEIAIYVNSGRLAVFNHIQEEDAVYIMAPAPRFFPCSLTSDSLARALAIDETEIDAKQAWRIINAGLRTLIVPLISLEVCLKVFPDQEGLRQFCINNDIDIILVFCEETYLSSNQYRTRVFAPKYGYLEDPATGSGNAAFGHYLIQQALWANNITIEQGPSRENPNIVKLRRYQKEGNDYIMFGGSAVLRIYGNYILQGNNRQRSSIPVSDYVIKEGR